MTVRRVALVIPNLSPGGAERSALNIAAAVRAYDCIVIAERPGGELGATEDAAAVQYASRDGAKRGRMRRVGRLVQAFRAADADIVVSMLSPVVTTIAADIAGLPVVHWLQNPFAHGLRAPVDRVLPGRPAQLVAKAILGLVSRRSALFAGASPGLVEELSALGVPNRKLAVLPNGVDLPGPSDEPKSLSDRTARIITVGRLAPQKRQDLLLQAFADLRRDVAATLTIVGSGPLESALRRRAAELGVASHVTFTGFVDRPSTFLTAADLFVLSSDYEGFGNVLVEALGCGLPVVATDVPYGPRFILGDTEDLGALVQPGSATALAAGMRNVVARLHQGEDFRRKARARAKAFSISTVARRFEQLLELTARER